MLNSETKYQLSISFNQRIDGIMLTLIDGTMEVVFKAVGQQIDMHLPEGIYKLNATFIDYSQEYPLLLNDNKDLTLDFNYPAVAPILDFKTTHEYYHGNAERYSHLATQDSNTDQPNFLFFGARYDKDENRDLLMQQLLAAYSISNHNNELLYSFNPDNTKFSEDFGWHAFSTKLITGLYFLQWKTASDSRVFPFYIIEGNQTQFFLRYSQAPDFENCFFFYSEKMHFRFDALEYLIVDKILFAYKDYSNYKLLTENEKQIIRQTPYLATLMEILQQKLGTFREFEKCRKLALPDLRLMQREMPETENTQVLPVLSSVMTQFAFNSKKQAFAFQPGSLIDRVIDHVRYDLFWNNFTKIDHPAEWIDIYKAYIGNSNLYPINSQDNRLIKWGKRMVNRFTQLNPKIQQERLQILTGQTEAANSMAKINDTINSIADLSAIASKLQLPATKVLRNYDTYKEIYGKLK